MSSERHPMNHTIFAALLLAGCAFVGCSDGGQQSPSTTPVEVAAPASQQSPVAPPTKEATDVGTKTSAVDGDWVKVSALDGRVSVTMPVEPKTESRTVQSKVGPIIFDSKKAATTRGVWNLLVVTYPEDLIASNPDSLAFLERLAEGNEKQKAGMTRDHVKEIENATYPAIEHRFHYPAGRNSEGGMYGAGFAIYRNYLVGNSTCSAFVDVFGSSYDAAPMQLDAEIDRFFSSFEIANKTE